MNKEPNNRDKPMNFFPSDDDFFRIFLPMIDDEEQRRLEELKDGQDEDDYLIDEDED